MEGNAVLAELKLLNQSAEKPLWAGVLLLEIQLCLPTILHSTYTAVGNSGGLVLIVLSTSTTVNIDIQTAPTFPKVKGLYAKTKTMFDKTVGPVGGHQQ